MEDVRIQLQETSPAFDILSWSKKRLRSRLKRRGALVTRELKRSVNYCKYIYFYFIYFVKGQDISMRNQELAYKASVL